MHPDSVWPRMGEKVWSVHTGREYVVEDENVDMGDVRPWLKIRCGDGSIRVKRSSVTRVPKRDRGQE